MRPSLKSPIPELFEAWDLLSAAANLHQSGDTRTAATLFRRADNPVLWDWLYPHWEKCHLNVVDRAPADDSATVAKADRHSKRFLDAADKVAVLQRDGYRCRYCGIPVISPEVRKTVCRLYPGEVPWDPNDPRKRHMGFQALWLQFDHVVPHSHGGRSDVENSVVSCALCNFGKDKYTLLQLGLEDPRTRAPVRTDWDGLEGLSVPKTARPQQHKPVPSIPRKSLSKAEEAGSEHLGIYFLAGARISKGYLYAQPIDGKERWFKLGAGISAEAATRGGKHGCLLTCAEVELLRRGLTPDTLLLLTKLASGPEAPTP